MRAVVFVLVLSFLSPALSADMQWNVEGEGTGHSTNDRRVLVIGASEYGGGWSPLPLVQSDVASLRRTFAGLGFHVDDNSVLANPPTRESLGLAIREFLEGPDPENNDTRVLYFAGHGSVDRETGRGYLVPVGARVGGPSSDLYPIDELVSPLRGSPARHVLVVFDSCHSGAVFGEIALRGNVSRGALGSTGRSRMFITAGAAEQKVPDDSIFRRSFESLLLSGVIADGSGRVLGSTLASEVRRAVAMASVASGIRQTPEFGYFAYQDPSRVADFVLESTSSVAQSAGSSSGVPFQDCEHCPPVVAIHVMPGSSEEFSASVPSRSFALGTHEVTFEAWDRCFSDGACDRWIPDHGKGRGNMPVFGITFSEAEAFLQWLTDTNGRGARYRLPTQKEWEFAALIGLDPQLYATSARPGRELQPVGRGHPTPRGLYDILGNVWEWVLDCGVRNSMPGESVDCEERVIVGGSFASGVTEPGLAPRDIWRAERTWKTIGFRVLREID